jgi:hypothetical protein
LHPHDELVVHRTVGCDGANASAIGRGMARTVG